MLGGAGVSHRRSAALRSYPYHGIKPPSKEARSRRRRAEIRASQRAGGERVQPLRLARAATPTRRAAAAAVESLAAVCQTPVAPVLEQRSLLSSSASRLSLPLPRRRERAPPPPLPRRMAAPAAVPAVAARVVKGGRTRRFWTRARVPGAAARAGRSREARTAQICSAHALRLCTSLVRGSVPSQRAPPPTRRSSRLGLARRRDRRGSARAGGGGGTTWAQPCSIRRPLPLAGTARTAPAQTQRGRPRGRPSQWHPFLRHRDPRWRSPLGSVQKYTSHLGSTLAWRRRGPPWSLPTPRLLQRSLHPLPLLTPSTLPPPPPRQLPPQPLQQQQPPLLAPVAARGAFVDVGSGEVLARRAPVSVGADAPPAQAPPRRQ